MTVSTGEGDSGTAADNGPAFLHLLPPSIIGFCLFFNFFLCFINTNIAAITPAVIILCEMALTAAAVGYGFYRIDRIKFFWLVVLGAQIALIITLSVMKGEVLMKPLRDIMIMPIFTVMGIAAFRVDFSRILIWLSIVIAVIALCEAFLTDAYLLTFNLREFYIAKGMLEGDKNITELDVFASGERPGGRFLFDLPGVHRISSVFLEPVSLGFFALVSGIYFIAAKEGISRGLYILGLSFSFVLIWLSDARLAFGVLALTFMMRPVFARVDHRLAVLIFPVVLLFAYAVDVFRLLDTTGEGMGARIHSTMNLLSHTTIDVFLGTGRYAAEGVADSGLGYMLNDQGFLGLLLFWLPPLLFLKSIPKEARIFLFGISIYIAFGMILTQAFFTIKTAALMWFCYGYLISRNLSNANGNYHYA